MDQGGVRQTFFGELREAGVIEGFVPGIEVVGEDVEENDDRDLPEDTSPATSRASGGSR